MNKKNLQLFFSGLVLVAFIVWAAVFNQSRADTAPHNLKVYFLNVGQGDSEYIKTPAGQDILIDGGPDSSVLGELGKVMDFGDREINLVVLTHPHADHLTGLIEVLRRYKVDEIWESGVIYPSATYDAWQKEIATQKISDQFVAAGKSENFGEIKISVLYPLSSLKNQKIDNLNNASVVTEIDFQNFSSLFLGDAETDAQAQFLNSLKPVTVVKAAHHGSSNGLNKDLYQITRPSVVAIEVGKNNTYGHPHQVFLDYLNTIATQIYRTDQDGTIEIDSDGQNWRVIP